MKLLLIACVLLLTVINCNATDNDMSEYQTCIDEVQFQYNYDGELSIDYKEYEAMIDECLQENK